MSPLLPIALAALTTAVAPPEHVLVATRTPTAPVIDGDLSDPVWIMATPVSGFTQLVPDEGKPGTRQTEVRLLYDDRAVYFGVHCYDADPSSISANLTRRDDWVFSDAFAVDLDTEGDHQRSYRFDVSAANVQRDGIRTGDQSVTFDWDSVWSSATRLTSDGWTLEIAIPFTTLRYSNPAHPDWRVQFRRYIPSGAESDYWVYIPRDVQGQMQRYARIEGLHDLPKVRGVGLQPYVMGRFESDRAPSIDNVPTGNVPGWGAGLDAHISLIPGLTLSATILPDFGQVESDPDVLNLTRFEVYLPEKRPFFLEGADLFDLHDAIGNPLASQLFYSRRLGATPPAPFLPTDVFGNEALEKQLPDVTQIWGAAKVTGRIGERVSIGLLDGVTSSESAQIQLPGGPTGTEGVVPLSNFLVGRLRVLLGGNLTAGVTLTSVNRDEPAYSIGVQGTCPDPDLLPNPPTISGTGRCTHDAQTGGTDLSWQTKDGGWAATGTVYGSHISGGPTRTLADGTTIASGDNDLGGRAEITRTAGSLVGSLTYEAAGPKLDLNDAGYLRQQNFQQVYGRIGWRLFNLHSLQDTTTQFETWLTDSTRGVSLGRYFQISNNTTWKNKWNIGGFAAVSLRTFDNRDAGDGTLTERPAYVAGELWGSSPYQKPLAFNAWVWGRNNWHGGSVAAGPGITARIGRRVNFSLGTQFSVNNGDPRWVATDGSGPNAEYLLGAQNSVSLSTTLRGTVAFSSTMTLQAYAQLFFASVDYTGLYEAAPVGRLRTVFLSALQPIDGDPHEYDTRDAVLNVNVVFRWEYRPGSALYLVYTRLDNGSVAPMPVGPTGIQLPARTFDWASFGQGAEQDVFEAKVAYYFGT